MLLLLLPFTLPSFDEKKAEKSHDFLADLRALHSELP